MLSKEALYRGGVGLQHEFGQHEALVESKHASKVETITSSGRLWSDLLLNQQMHPCEANGSIKSFGISDISEDPANTTCIVHVLSPNNLQVLHMHSKFLAARECN